MRQRVGRIMLAAPFVGMYGFVLWELVQSREGLLVLGLVAGAVGYLALCVWMMEQ